MTANHVQWQDPCDQGHDLCEGRNLHIRTRCANGCPQFQDGSWIDRSFCREPHPGKPEGLGQADVTLAFIRSGLSRLRP